MIIDGEMQKLVESTTIVDVCWRNCTLPLRPGAITKEMLETVIGHIEIDPAILAKPKS